MANYLQQERTSLSLALEMTRQLFDTQIDTIKDSLIEKEYKEKLEPTLKKMMTDAIERTRLVVHLMDAKNAGPDGPQVISAELFARELIVGVWIKYRNESGENLPCFFRLDPLPEDCWFQQPLSPEHAEYMEELHAHKLRDETSHLKKSAGDILKSHGDDEVKCRQGLKCLIAKTDEFIQDDAQSWTIIVTYICRDWPGKGAWASDLM